MENQICCELNSAHSGPGIAFTIYTMLPVEVFFKNNPLIFSLSKIVIYLIVFLTYRAKNDRPLVGKEQESFSYDVSSSVESE